MNRKEFLTTSAFSAAGITTLTGFTILSENPYKTNDYQFSGSNINETEFRYIFPKIESSQSFSIPEGLRIPFGWPTLEVPPSGSGKGPILKWNDKVNSEKPCSLRFSIALDVREEKQIEVVLAESEEVVASFDVRYAPVHQIQSVAIEAKYIPAIMEQGIRLQMKKGETPLWVLSSSTNFKDNTKALLPHIMIPGNSNPLNAFFDRLFSLDSIQQFGWMEGCVTDSLWDFSLMPKYAEIAQKTLAGHLKKFLNNNDLVYENPRSKIADNIISGGESTLPFAAIAKLYPDHPAIELAIKYWRSRYAKGVNESESHNITTEGCYTIAYPMMVIGNQRKDDQLIEYALKVLRTRRDLLKERDTVFQIRYRDNKRAFRNWARGIAWYILGLTRSLMILHPEDRPADLLKDLQMTAEWIMSHQLEGGVWRCFVDERGIRIDTSGSAGIAASLALGVKSGMLSPKAWDSAIKASVALQDYLTDDGLLTAAAQSNRSGERLQRDDYRVIYQMGMGLMGQLIAAIDRG